MEKQQNLFEQGYEKTICSINNDYTCNHYWAIRTMQACDDTDCTKKCCYGCNEICGYRCNGPRKKGEKHN